MGFEELQGAVDVSAALTPPTAEELAFAEEKLNDEKALGLVLTDLSTTVKFVSSKNKPSSLDQADNDFRALVSPKKWKNSDEYRSSLSMPLILEVIESLLPQIFLAFFSDKQPFILTAQGTTSQEAARAASKVLKWAVKKSGFKEGIRQILKSCLQYGTGVGKWGGEKGVEQKKKYTRGTKGDEAGKVVSERVEVPYFCPKFERIDLRNVFVDPALRTQDIRDGKFVIVQKFITANDLDELRDDPTYKNIPSREKLKEILAAKTEATVDGALASKAETLRDEQAERQNVETSFDPLQQPLELLEYVTPDRIITILQQKIVIRNGENDDYCGFVSESFIDVLNAFYGLGIGTLLRGEQKLQAGVANRWIDSLDLILNPAFTQEGGVAAKSQNVGLAPGKLLNNGKMEPVEIPSVTAEALQALAVADTRARRRVGANFGPDMPTQAMRTAEGVQEFTSGIETRTQYFVERFADNVFIPSLEALLVQCKENMTPDDINRVLTEEEQHAYDGDILEFYNGFYGIEVLSSVKLAAKRAMLSLVPSFIQLFSAKPVQDSMLIGAKKFDWSAFAQDMMDLAGWDYNGWIVEATPDDLKRAMMLNPAAIKAQSDQALQQNKQQNDLELESAKGDVRAGIQVVKHILDESAAENEPEKPLATRPSKE